MHETVADSERNRDAHNNSYINDKISGYSLNVLAMQFLPVGCRNKRRADLPVK